MKKQALFIAVSFAIAVILIIVWNNQRSEVGNVLPQQPDHRPDSDDTIRWVVKDSLEKANVGDYEAAKLNLFPGEQSYALVDPDFMEHHWDRITKRRTINSVTVTKVSDEAHGERYCHFTVSYKDGSTSRGKVEVQAFVGRWRLRFTELLELNPGPLPPLLHKEYTIMKNTGVALRIPKGMVWDPKDGSYHDPSLGIRLSIDSSNSRSFNSANEWVTAQWDRPENKFVEYADDFSNPAVKTIFRAGKSKNANGKLEYLMHWIKGNERASVLITARLPNRMNVIIELQECLTTARWEK